MAVPTDFSGLWTWLKADALALNHGDLIASWTDSSGNARHATQATDVRKPTYQTNTLNGGPVVRFDVPDSANGDYLSLPDASALTAATVFVVVKIDADPPPTTTKSGLWDFGESGESTHFPYTDSNVYDDFGTFNRKSTGNPTLSLASWRTYTVLTKSATWTSWVDGTQHYTTASNTVDFLSAPVLGGNVGGGFWLDGDIAEFILYDNDLGSTNRTAIWDYLALRYPVVTSVSGNPMEVSL